MARNKKVEILSHDGEVLHPITDGDCVIFPDGETLTHKLSEDEAIMYTPEVVNSSPMFKVGEGDTSDYSSSVLDGAYQEAILKGQTYVNTIQEPSADEVTLPTPFTEYERTQSKTFTEMQDGTFGLNLVGQSYVNCIQEPSEPSYVALGENLEFQNKKVEYTTDGQIKSAMLKGQTLVNLASGSVGIVGTVTVIPGGGWKWLGTRLEKLEANKTYMSIFYVDSNTLDGVIKDVFQTVDSNGNLSTVWGITVINAGATGIFKRKFMLDGNIKHYNVYSDTSTTGSATLRCMILEYQEGMENLDIPYFQGMQSVTMSTELENVCSRYNSSVAKNGKTFTVGTAADRGLKLSEVANISNYNFKQNTKYLMQFKISNLNLDGLENIKLYFSESDISTGNSLFGNLVNAMVRITKNGIYRVVLTTSAIVNTSNFVIKGIGSEWENSSSTSRSLTISQIMCIEYQNGMENWDLPYFETTQLMKPFKVRTMSKNLCPVGKGQFFNCFFKAGTQFTLSTKDGVASNGGNIVFKDKDGNSMWLGIDSGASISRTTLAKDAYQIVNQLNSEAIQYQLEEGTSVTSFVPREEKTTSALEPITLRATGDAIDTLDLSTGEYIQRVGEVLLDGSQNWYLDTVATNADTTIFYTDENYNGFKLLPDYADRAKYNKCDKLPVVPGLWNANVEGIMSNQNGKVYIAILKSRLSSQTVDSFKSYLASNPIRFVSILANPITRKISLEYPNLQTYQDITHVQSIAMDGTLIPKIFLPSVISYKAMLKPNTSYNVIVDREVIDSTNQLTVNLGGTTANITANRTVVRTPSTLSNETLTFNGKDNRLAKAMLIEGSTLINGDLPHFDGIGDVKLGRVVENLCMANESYAGSSATTNTLTNNEITCKVTSAGSRVVLFDFTKPIQNGKKYFVYAPCSKMFAIGIRTFYNNITYYDVAKTNITNYATLSVDNSILNDCKLFIGQLGAMPVDTTMTIRRPIICEYVDGMENWDWESIGYFTGTKNIGNEFMRIGNKNLFDKDYSLLISSDKTKDIGNDTIEFYQNDSRFYISPKDGKFKENTQYTLSFQKVEGICLFYITYTDGTTEQVSNTTTTAKNKTIHMIRSFYSDGSKSVVKNIQLEEASSATSYVAHKHNVLYLPKDESIALTWEQGSISYSTGGSWTDATNNTNTTRIRTQLLDLEPNETYRVSYGGNGYKYAIGFYNNSNIGSSVLTTTTMNEYYFTTTKDVHKIGIVVTTSNDGNITPSALHQVRLEKVTDIHLRSVGSVKDELDLTRGVCIQRINEVVLNGSENWVAESKNSNVTSRFSLKVNDMLNENIHTVNDNNLNASGVFPVLFRGLDDQEQIFSHNAAINIRINDSKLNVANDVDSFKAYLQSNPITVQYKLATPIKHKINIPMKNELNQTIAKPNGIFTLPLMYSGTNHVNINSQIYPKVQSRDYIAYPVIANNSQLHTVFHNKLGTGNLTVNLCGTSVTSVDGTSKCTITTPSTISQYELRLSGANNKVSNICVFNGDYMNVNVPYVEGMMNAVNPTVTNIGKNLVTKADNIWYFYDNAINSSGTSYNCGIAPVEPHKQYVINKDSILCFYDENDKCTNSPFQYFNANLPRTAPANSKYMLVRHNGGDNATYLDGLQIIEYGQQFSNEPYKENICEPDYGQIKLTRNMFEQGSFNELSSEKDYYKTKTASTHALQLKRIRLIDPIPVKPNTKHIVKFNGLEDYDIFVAYFKNNERVGFEGYWKNKEFTTPSDCNQIVFVLKRKGDAQILVDDIDYSKLIFSKVDETIHLRSLPNGVRDELNLETGEYVQRVGEITFDGSETGWDGNAANNNTFRIRCNVAYINNTTIHAICKEYEPRDYTSSWDTGKFISVSKDKKITFRDDNFSQGDTASWKAYLQTNPITVQYQLATPVIKHVNIHNYPHSYKDGHIIIESGDPSTNVTAQMTYRCVANRTGQIQEHTEQVEKQERQINELETLILENIRLSQNRSQNFLTSLISTLEIEEE